MQLNGRVCGARRLITEAVLPDSAAGQGYQNSSSGQQHGSVED